MHCPDCGTRATSNQKIRRLCGFSLEKAEATNPLPPESYPYSPVSVTEQTTARLEERTKTAS
jgi:hypothetical protein